MVPEQMIVVGFEFNSKTTVESLCAALGLTGCASQCSVIACLVDKLDTPAFQVFARPYKVFGIAKAEAKTVQTQTSSLASYKSRGVACVSEATALCAAGTGATLLVPRVIAPDRATTCAIAIGEMS